MPMPPQKKNCLTALNPMSEIHAPLAPDLEFRDWEHGGVEAQYDNNPSLALEHAAALLPSALPYILEARNHLMNPHRFHL